MISNLMSIQAGEDRIIKIGKGAKKYHLIRIMEKNQFNLF